MKIVIKILLVILFLMLMILSSACKSTVCLSDSKPVEKELRSNVLWVEHYEFNGGWAEHKFTN
jgi:hypothetical protein